MKAKKVQIPHIESMCDRVNQRIECPECGYPASEAMYWLDEYSKIAYLPGRPGSSIPDPGHYDAG